MAKQLTWRMLWFGSAEFARKCPRLATFGQTIHHLEYALCGFCWFRLCLTVAAWAGIVDDVRIALAQNNFSAAEVGAEFLSQLSRASRGEYLEAYSWMGRAALDQRQYDQAAAYAKQTQTQALELLKKRSLDAEPHLPIALGAALEVQSQVLAARGQRTQAVALLQSALQTYGNTSIRATGCRRI
jgi:tetratricopeptide (TPR) repeat protein